MPEPDFDQIARVTVDGPEWGEEYDPEPMRTRVAEQLRQVWNARGAADIAKLEYLEVIPDYVSDDAIRSLDR